jgi:hypothetical protein
MEHMPKEWKMGLISPYIRKGTDCTETNKNRGVTLLCTTYTTFTCIYCKEH